MSQFGAVQSATDNDNVGLMSKEKALSLDALIAELYSSSSERRRKAAGDLRQRSERGEQL
jgi:hypothetical protein